jgi:hypothetical protein
MPSRADIEMTKAIVEVAKPLGISVHDHLIVGRTGMPTHMSTSVPCGHGSPLAHPLTFSTHPEVDRQATLKGASLEEPGPRAAR